jgi:cyclophilin family peptidyl-prolyl cis-trans isomerase/HEAT repeat protein
MRKFLFLLLLLPLLHSCGDKTTSTPEPPAAVNAFGDSLRVVIADLQHARDGQGLLAYTKAELALPYRLAALKGLASVQDSNVVSALIPLLSDPDSSIQREAAYALGQTGHASAAQALLQLGRSSQVPSTIESAMEAYGKCGLRADLDSLLSSNPLNQISDQNEAGMMAALYRFGARGIVEPATDSIALGAIEHQQSQATFWACAFLGRVRSLGNADNPSRLLAAFSLLKDPDHQQLMVRRLGRCDAPECRSKLDSLVENKQVDWRVRVNAIRALAELKPERVPAAVMKSATDDNVHVAAEVATYLRDFARPEDLPSCQALSAGIHLGPVRPLLFAATVRLLKGTSRSQVVRDDVLAAMRISLTPHERGLYFMALAQDPAHEQLLSDSLLPLSPVISTYVMDALTYLYKHFPGDEIARIGLLQKAVETGDVAMVGQAATLLRDEQAKLSAFVTDTSFLSNSLDRLKFPKDIETWNEVRKTLDFIAHRPEGPPMELPKAAPIDWALTKAIPSKAIWKLVTNQGDIRIHLHVEDAPATVTNIVRLTREKFFDGKYIHRMIPNFVAQGGCPRGDGWGSTEPLLRSEWPGLGFTKGAVGMASAGKDTESCQFFITHSATPHLDGRYTVFGYVVSGQEVVDKLQVGDRILEAMVE